MDLNEWRRELRIAVARNQPSRIIELVTEEPVEECLQSAGLALMLATHLDEFGSAASRLIELLRKRDWEGDDELAASLGGASPSTLRPVPVDLEGLADVLGSGLGEEPGLLDVRTGEVWPAAALDYLRETDDPALPPEPDGVVTLEVAPEGSAEPYRDMVVFIDRLDDARFAERLRRAIEGKGAFRRFRSALDDAPTELTRWHAFSDERRLGRAQAWLAAAGFTPVPRSPDTTP